MESTYTSLLIFRWLCIAAILLVFDSGICKRSDDGLNAMDQIERANRNFGRFVICRYFIYCFVSLRLEIFFQRPCIDCERAENSVANLEASLDIFPRGPGQEVV